MKVQPSMKDCRSVRTPGIYLWGVVSILDLRMASEMPAF
jgi:hypothetical protein